MVGTLQRRIINVTLKLNEPGPAKDVPAVFDDKGNNTINLRGHRVQAKIVKAGAVIDSQAQLTIYGMTKSAMDRICTQGMAPVEPQVRKSSITIEAGDYGSKPTLVFMGSISSAYGDYNAAPNTALKIEAQSKFFGAVQPAPVQSTPGPVKVEVLMRSLATIMDLKFENTGVDVTLPSSYYYGSPRTQAIQIAYDANIWLAFDNGILAIWPKGQARKQQAPLVSAKTGMVGYPTWESPGIKGKVLFNPNINIGAAIMLESSIEPAKAINGEWIVNSLDYDLDSETPHGNWFMSFEATRRGVIPRFR